eukprot:5447393-Prymnesium_polylepis.1
MFGVPGGDPNALLPLSGVKYELVRSGSDAADEGARTLPSVKSLGEPEPVGCFALQSTLPPPRAGEL